MSATKFEPSLPLCNQNRNGHPKVSIRSVIFCKSYCRPFRQILVIMLLLEKQEVMCDPNFFSILILKMKEEIHHNM